MVSEARGANQPDLFTRAVLPPGVRYRVDLFDAVAWLESLPDASVHCVITDPAYESLEKHRAKGTTTRLKISAGSSNVWFPIFKNERFHALFRQLHRVLVKNAHCYILCDQETMFVVKPIAEEVGFKWWKAIIWDKQAIGMGYHYRSRHEVICFLEKGKRKLNKLGIADVLAVKRVHDAYPTEKPVELLKILVDQSTSPGEIVADPFVGSGSTGEAALVLGRRFVGCDITDLAVDTSRERLEGYLAPQTHP